MTVIARDIRNREITSSDRGAPWITDDVEKAIKHKHCEYHKYVKQGREPEDWARFKQVRVFPKGGAGGSPITTLSPSIKALSPHKNFQKTIGKTRAFC